VGSAGYVGDGVLRNGCGAYACQQRPTAGYTRLRELIEARPDRKFPSWHPQRGEPGAPQLFIVEPTCGELAEQLQSAPLQPIDKADGGEKIDPAGKVITATRCCRPVRGYGLGVA
jgi:hypothetical protein